MKDTTHIADVLNDHLQQIGSTLVFTAESNEIGEQIAYKVVNDRFIEIIRVDTEVNIWASFQDNGVFMPSVIFTDIEELTKIVVSFLELKVSLKDFFNTETTIKSPIDISNLTHDKEIILELSWFNFLQPTQYDYIEPKEWLIMIQFAKSIQSIAKTKKLFPDRSVCRLCFYSNKENNLEDFPCIWVSKKKEPITYGIGYHNGTKLFEGSKKEITAAFEKIIEDIIIN